MRLFVSCLSLVSPVGYSPASSTAALRAGVPAFADSVYLDLNGEPIVAAAVESLDPKLWGQKRVVELARMTLEEAALDCDERLPWLRMPLILCSRDAERPGPTQTSVELVMPFAARSVPLGTRGIQSVPRGSCAVLDALGLASAQLADPTVPACLIFALDSLIDARSLAWLERTQRLKTSARTDGVIPGEAAGLALVAREPLTDDAVCVTGVGAASEAATILNDEPFRADGMTRALRNALEQASLPMHAVDFRLSDAAGESYAFEELVLAQTRLMRKVRPSQPLWHAADCMGDCGAAAGLVQLAWASEAFARGYAPGTVAALHTASAFGHRSAAIAVARTGSQIT